MAPDETKAKANAAQKQRNEERRAAWDSAWVKAYTASIAQSLKGKKCAAAACPCQGKSDATHYLKQKGLANLSKPSLSHSFGEVAWQIHNGVPACDLAKKKQRTGSYVRVIDKQAAALAKELGVDEAKARAVLEAARNN